MIKLKQAVIVEGKYDKIKLANFLDALIISTEGFAIFKDKEKRELIKLLAKEFGIIIMTDSDNAGLIIRQHIKNFVKQGNITEVYLPQIKGKEKRKTSYSAEGYLGLEGLSEQIIKEALLKSGAVFGKTSLLPPLTKADLYELHITGRENSAALRKKVLAKLRLPNNLSTANLLEYVNRSDRQKELIRVCEECLQEEDKK